MPEAPTVFVVDDDHDFLKSVQFLLEALQLPVVPLSSALEFLRAFRPGQPCCLLLDVVMPGMNGLELLGELNRRGWHVPTIMMTGFGEVRDAVQAIKMGALDYVEKPFHNHKDILDLVHQALESDKLERRAREEALEVARRLKLLTDREREVLGHVVDGNSSRQIGEQLGVAASTIDTHRASILRKMNAQSLPHLIRLVSKHAVINDSGRTEIRIDLIVGVGTAKPNPSEPS